MMGAAIDWRSELRELEVGEHEGAALFPLGPDEALDSLGASIDRNGLLVMLRLWQETEFSPWLLVDGRRRCAAMARLPDGDLRIRNAISLAQRSTGGNPLDLIDGLNHQRRHLPLEERRAIAAKLLALDPSRSDRVIAKQAGLTHPTVAGIRAQGEPTGKFTSSTRVGGDGRARRQPTPRPRREPECAPLLPPIVQERPQVEAAPAPQKTNLSQVQEHDLPKVTRQVQLNLPTFLMIDPVAGFAEVARLVGRLKFPETFTKRQRAVAARALSEALGVADERF